MGLDLRYPIGLMFFLLGAILVGYGLLHPDLRAPLTPINLNVDAGLFMLSFGITMAALARRAKK
ncbi:MAG TPA: hypothetical protein VFA54_14540 [Bryobacterales bacterium]|jgi:hypothetical protein|nr:hypothetical protein [Bryobacterales bacterium]